MHAPDYGTTRTLAQDRVGERLVLTVRHLGMPRSLGACYSTMTTGLALTDAPCIVRADNEDAALMAHAEAVNDLYIALLGDTDA